MLRHVKVKKAFTTDRGAPTTDNIVRNSRSFLHVSIKTWPDVSKLAANEKDTNDNASQDQVVRSRTAWICPVVWGSWSDCNMT